MAIQNIRDMMQAKLRVHYAQPTEWLPRLLQRYIVDNPTYVNQGNLKQYYMTKLTAMVVAYDIRETVPDLEWKYWNAYV